MRAVTLIPLHAEQVDLPAVRAVLHRWRLRPATEGPYLIGGGPGYRVEASWLGAGARSFYATVFATTFGPTESRLLHELAVAGRLLLTPDPAPPDIVVCGRIHSLDEVYGEDEVISFVDSAAQLHRVLNLSDAPA